MSFSEGIQTYSRVKALGIDLDIILPGDILQFNYDGTPRIGLVVRSRKTGMGVMRYSTRGNLLVNAFLIDSLSVAMTDILINNLYRNRVRATYRNSPKILGAIMGSHNFRTFIYNKFGPTKMIFIDKSSKKEEIEGEQ